MIVWGGIGGGPYLNTGGRYNAGTDSWTATSTTNAPSGRYFHTAVWTDSEMIIWGGDPSLLNTGGRYHPGTDSWTATDTTNAPSGRHLHTAVWTGSVMVIWGGGPNTGGRYHPSTDTWRVTSTTNAPSARLAHTAVWTGSEMVVWGGELSSRFYQHRREVLCSVASAVKQRQHAGLCSNGRQRGHRRVHCARGSIEEGDHSRPWS